MLRCNCVLRGRAQNESHCFIRKGEISVKPSAEALMRGGSYPHRPHVFDRHHPQAAATSTPPLQPPPLYTPRRRGRWLRHHWIRTWSTATSPRRRDRFCTRPHSVGEARFSVDAPHVRPLTVARADPAAVELARLANHIRLHPRLPALTAPILSKGVAAATAASDVVGLPAEERLGAQLDGGGGAAPWALRRHTPTAGRRRRRRAARCGGWRGHAPHRHPPALLPPRWSVRAPDSGSAGVIAPRCRDWCRD